MAGSCLIWDKGLDEFKPDKPEPRRSRNCFHHFDGINWDMLLPTPEKVIKNDAHDNKSSTDRGQCRCSNKADDAGVLSDNNRVLNKSPAVSCEELNKSPTVNCEELNKSPAVNCEELNKSPAVNCEELSIDKTNVQKGNTGSKRCSLQMFKNNKVKNLKEYETNTELFDRVTCSVRCRSRRRNSLSTDECSNVSQDYLNKYASYPTDFEHSDHPERQSGTIPTVFTGNDSRQRKTGSSKRTSLYTDCRSKVFSNSSEPLKLDFSRGRQGMQHKTLVFGEITRPWTPVFTLLEHKYLEKKMKPRRPKNPIRFGDWDGGLDLDASRPSWLSTTCFRSSHKNFIEINKAAVTRGATSDSKIKGYNSGLIHKTKTNKYWH